MEEKEARVPSVVISKSLRNTTEITFLHVKLFSSENCFAGIRNQLYWGSPNILLYMMLYLLTSDRESEGNCYQVLILFIAKNPN